jgi:NAD(P)-dependent dehydrogenase (short-subunit alcohol dehydrogenase family)
MADVSAKSVLITGTTSGIGRALLEHYVQEGAKVIAVNRRRVPDLEARYPAVRFACVDVREAEQVERFVSDLAAADEVPEILVLNAGINRIDNDGCFDLQRAREVVDTNLYGVLNFVAPLTRLPASSVRRHVVAISSMASYVGNPYALAYHASKRALTACFAVWSKMYAGTDLVFQRVMLGPVPTSIFTMAERLPRWMGWLKDRFSASPSDAARTIARFALTRKKRLLFPLRTAPLYLAMGLGQRAIPGFFQGRRTLDGRRRRSTPPM